MLNDELSPIIYKTKDIEAKVNLLKEKKAFLEWTKQNGENIFDKFYKELHQKTNKEILNIENLIEEVKNI